MIYAQARKANVMIYTQARKANVMIYAQARVRVYHHICLPRLGVYHHICLPRLGVYHHFCLPRLGVYHHICLSKSKILSRLNLDARSVPEALVNSFRILTPLPTRLNPPESQIPFKKKSARTSIKNDIQYSFLRKSRSLIPKIALPSRNSDLKNRKF